jgi:hypothetical protein
MVLISRESLIELGRGSKGMMGVYNRVLDIENKGFRKSLYHKKVDSGRWKRFGTALHGARQVC